MRDAWSLVSQLHHLLVYISSWFLAKFCEHIILSVILSVKEAETKSIQLFHLIKATVNKVSSIKMRPTCSIILTLPQRDLNTISSTNPTNRQFILESWMVSPLIFCINLFTWPEELTQVQEDVLASTQTLPFLSGVSRGKTMPFDLPHYEQLHQRGKRHKPMQW